MVQVAVNPSRPRQRLLDAAITFVAAHGLQDRSLREIAAAIGTSHRMLIYHFGSKEGLMKAIVEEVEGQQHQFMARLMVEPALPPREAALVMWQHLTDPALANNIRLFFELYGQALQGRAGTEGFLDDIIESWLGPLTEYEVARGVPPAQARADARLGLAISRGLLLDLLTTGDRAAVDAAYERFLDLFGLTTPLNS